MSHICCFYFVTGGFELDDQFSLLSSGLILCVFIIVKNYNWKLLSQILQYTSRYQVTLWQLCGK